MSGPSETSRDARRAFQAPRGTRDFYPRDMLRRRWIEERWRKTSIIHGFEEIDGPRFEHADLYTVKSGEGILSELFSFTRAGGDTRFALRPEFTPTLARMVAAKAASLPRPIKWFSVGPYFRAERPQRGRLREFLQWNVDIIGELSPSFDAELIACLIDFLKSLGLTEKDARIKIGDRSYYSDILHIAKIPASKHDAILQALDASMKEPLERIAERLRALELNNEQLRTCMDLVDGDYGIVRLDSERAQSQFGIQVGEEPNSWIDALLPCLKENQALSWCDWDPRIIRGLAYYTGIVFEVHEVSGKERAIAGGGRYDNLVELFGGPPTPAVGFAMGDVVLANVLQDKGLMPTDAQLADELGLRPDVFVIPTGSAESDAALRPVVASLRQAGLHARHSSRATRNTGKLLKEAASCGARFAAILTGDGDATLKNLDDRTEREGVPLDSLADTIRRELDAH